MICAAVERCAGIDVGKKWLSVCVMIGPLEGEPRVEKRRFGTTVGELEQLRDWLQKEAVTHVVMESTGSYWKPVFNVLEDAVKVYLANAQEVKARKGHKTDDKDGWWLAHLLRHAMIHPSFIPPRSIRELRDLTRRRERLNGAGTSEKNRVQKILEDANVKLGNVLSDVFGVSGQLMLEALLKGEARPEEIARFAQGRAKQEDSSDHGGVGGAPDERASSKDDPLQFGPHAVSRRATGRVRPRYRGKDSGSGVGSGMAAIADGAGDPGAQCGEDPRRDGAGHGAVSVRETDQFLGGSLSGEQPERGQEPQQSNDGRQSMAARRPDRVRVGGRGEEEQLSEGEVLAHGHQVRGQETARAGGGSTHPVDFDLRGSAQRPTLPGAAKGASSGHPNGASDPAPHSKVGQTRRSSLLRPAGSGQAQPEHPHTKRTQQAIENKAPHI